jgi:hypothetical protein
MGEIALYNTSHKTIVGYTLGWNIRNRMADSFPLPRSGSQSLGALAGPSVTTALKPKNSEKTNQGQSMANSIQNTLKSRKAKGSWVVVVGVTDVVFEDGTHWTADPASFHAEN